MNTPTQKFAEFQSSENGQFRMRLGHSVYVQKGNDVYWINRSGVLVLVSKETHATKPWIRENFERERKFQKRKALAIGLQNSNIPSYERRAYKKRMGWVGA